jgi:tetratricopeptide (TPR) repeat protein
MRPGILGGIFAFSFVLWLAAAPGALAADRNAADALRDAGRYAEAIRIYEEVLREYPDDGPGLFGLGFCQTYLGLQERSPERCRQATETLKRLVEKVPGYADYRHFYGFSLLCLAQNLKGEEDLRKSALAQAEKEVLEALPKAAGEPQKDQYQSTLGQIYLEGGKADKAREVFVALVQKYSTYPYYAYWLGEAERMLGNEPAAVEAYLKAMAGTPKITNPVACLSQISSRLRSEGKLRESAALDERIVALKPDPFYHGWALKELSDNRVDLGDNEGAIAALREAEEVKPDEAMFPNRMGLVFLAMGDREKGMEAFRRAMQKNRLLLYPYENIGTELAALGKIEDARDIYKRGRKAAEEVVASSPRADIRAEAAFYMVLFGWNLDELEAYRK